MKNKDEYNINNAITAVIVGAGHRSMLYSSYADQYPDRLKIVGVVDPNKLRREMAVEAYNIPEENCFESVEQLKEVPQIADAVINGTMDKLHIPTTIPVLEAGYNVLLEKPIGISKNELLVLLAETRKYNKIVMICHVLRYAPFYVEIKKKLLAGEIGEIISVTTEENVSYHHMATSYVRGKWRNKEGCMSPIILAKCCHDLDLITWMKSGVKPVMVSSFGGLSLFRSDKAPEGSGTRCLVDCEIEKSCPFSAYVNYVVKNRHFIYTWEFIEHLGPDPTEEQKINSLRADNPYGRCVWKCDNDVMDHQSVLIEFEDGSTATHVLSGAAAKPCRTIHIFGTKGEISGVLEDGRFVVRRFEASEINGYTEDIIELEITDDMHGGGDLLLVEDFVKVLKGEESSVSTTKIEDSIYGHLIGFAADESLNLHKIIDIENI